MKKVTLQFDTIHSAVDYLSVIKNGDCEVNRRDVVVTCLLSEADLELAQNGYHATILQLWRTEN